MLNAVKITNVECKVRIIIALGRIVGVIIAVDGSIPDRNRTVSDSLILMSKKPK